MSIQEIKDFLTRNPGYLKWGIERIATQLDAELIDVLKAKEELKQDQQFEESADMKILFLDIETAPLLSWVWGIWDQNINLDAVEYDWFILAFSYKWANKGNVKGEVLTSEEVANEDDSYLIKKLWKLLDQATHVVTHNGDKFDLKKINTRFIKLGLGPVSPFKSIDTLKVSRKNFSFTSNKLDFLVKEFGMEGKHETDFNLWKACMHGDKEALIKMQMYNENDVLILEQLYYKLLPWIKNINYGLYTELDSKCCPSCGSNKLLIIDNQYISTVGKYLTYRCGNCGHISRERKSILNKIQNKNILTSIK